MSPRARSPRTGRRRLLLTLAVVGIAAFVVVDGALAFAALRSGHGSGVEQAADPVPDFLSPSPDASSSASGSPAPSATPAPSSSQVAIAQTGPEIAPSGAVQLVAVDANVAYRATNTGSCAAGGSVVLERSGDGGSSWTALGFGSQDVRQVTGMGGASATQLSLAVLTGKACTPAQLSSFTSGKFWASSPTAVAPVAYVDAKNGASLHVGGKTLTAPCPAAAVDESSDALVAVCPDTVVVGAPAGPLHQLSMPGVVAGTATSGAVLVAALGEPSCDGIAIDRVGISAASAPQRLGCAALNGDASVAISAAGQAVWIWQGDSTQLSTDGGATWHSAP